ncbi:von Willebrand factor A domain-containing protein 7 isoform X1 [Trichosurus vulpecula]|uniref:von Willebrand factor A domain-containing protein 7 isoform X1 n=2 Tax=Trichosurus vulpecula TaxID=9337 RepID=UPI00186B564A|nr:von Willebrand factor A domain-containing protein 7 isoform X1 [Trichosurus vulpecula]
MYIPAPVFLSTLTSQVHVSAMAPLKAPRPCLGSLLLLLLWLCSASGFFPNIWSLVAAPTSITHQDLTEEAALNVTLQLFLEQPPPGRNPLHLEDFQGRTLLADDLFAAYFGLGTPTRRFRAALGEVARANAAQDFLSVTRNDPELHFDAEQLIRSRARLVGSLREALSAARALEYTLARQRLGAMLHALQDFYSHSNWVELGEQQPHPDLLWPGRKLKNLAQAGDPMCSDCEELSCPGNLLGSLFLTSGYFGAEPPKPPGKCSHGGHFDRSSHDIPRGGINKDSTSPAFSPHHHLHPQAAQLALQASIQALNLLRGRLGDTGFSRLLQISPASGLSFVLDTTGSMGEEINAAKIEARRIIDQRRGGPMEPTHYILVPFHDPGFGPVLKTSDPDAFWKHLNEIHALGGGDEPEMCLSALELALLHTPHFSDIFVFTDASPKDAHLTNRVEALSQKQHCKVTFLVTEDPSRRVRRDVLSPKRFEPYQAIAMASGGEVIFTKDQYIQNVASVVGESMMDMVTLALVPPVPPPKGPLMFHVDKMLHGVIIHLHGEISTFRISDPTGISQDINQDWGPLGHIQCFGQFWTVNLNDPLQVGAWVIEITAQGTPGVRVKAKTSLDFLFSFGTPIENGPHPGLYPLSQPVAGLHTLLLVEVMGLVSGIPNMNHSHVILRGSLEGEELGHVALKPTEAPERGLFTALLDPKILLTQRPFFLELFSQDDRGSILQRVASQPCTVVPVLLELSGPSGPLSPGHQALLSLQISSFSGPWDLIITASVSPSFPLTSNLSRVHLGQNESVWGHFRLQVPGSATLDSLVTVTVTAEAKSSDPPPPAHALLQLLVQAFPSQEQLDDPGPSSRPSNNIARPDLHTSTLGPQRSGAGGTMGAGPWWGPVRGLLLVLGIAAW